MRTLLRAFGLSIIFWLNLVPAWSQPPSSSDLEVHLIRRDDPGVELVYPCCAVEAPAGAYFWWLEEGWRMTPYSALVFTSDTQPLPFPTTPLGDAGRVTLSPQEVVEPGIELRLLYAGRYFAGPFQRWEISRWKAVDDLGKGLLLPVGPAIGGLWDPQRQKYVALSRPFQVRGRTTTAVPLDRPQGVAHLIVQAHRRHVEPGEQDETRPEKMVLRRQGREMQPDLVVSTADRIYAVWYELAPGPAEVRGSSKEGFFEPHKVDLLAGQIEYVKGELKPRPDLEVQLKLPAELKEEKLTLEVRHLPSKEAVDHAALRPADYSHRFEAVPPALLEVELQTSFGPYSRQVDLSSGEDGFLLLEPDLLTLRGAVYHGDEGHPAKLTFNTVAPETKEVRTDEQGAYKVVLLDPVRSVSIELDEVETAPYVDFFSPAVAESKELDFHIPDADIQVKVLDSATRKGVPGAFVAIRNVYLQEDDAGEGSTELKKKERVVSQSAETDKMGTARLAFLRKGSLEIRASAEGYSPLRQPVQAQVVDEQSDQSYEVLLQPVGETVALRLRLPNGAPASGAEVMLVDSLESGQGLFSERADREGVIKTPRKQAGILLVKHPAAAFLVREWRPQEDEDEMAWDLPPAADRPLTVHVKDAAGKSAAARAEMVLWLDGRRLSGGVLAWLAGTRPMADSNGYWTGTNLPRKPVALLAWGLQARQDARSGSLDSQAVRIEFPWPDPVEVRAFE